MEVGKAPAGLGALEAGRVVGCGAAAGAKEGCLIVDVVDEVFVLCADGRRFAWLGKAGGGAAALGDSVAPSRWELDGKGLLGLRTGSSFSSTGGDGVLLRGLPGDSGSGCASSLLL